MTLHWFDMGSETCEGCDADPMCPNDVLDQERQRIIQQLRYGPAHFYFHEQEDIEKVIHILWPVEGELYAK